MWPGWMWCSTITSLRLIIVGVGYYDSRQQMWINSLRMATLRTRKPDSDIFNREIITIYSARLSGRWCPSGIRVWGRSLSRLRLRLGPSESFLWGTSVDSESWSVDFRFLPRLAGKPACCVACLLVLPSTPPSRGGGLGLWTGIGLSMKSLMSVTLADHWHCTFTHKFGFGSGCRWGCWSCLSVKSESLISVTDKWTYTHCELEWYRSKSNLSVRVKSLISLTDHWYYWTYTTHKSSISNGLCLWFDWSPFSEPAGNGKATTGASLNAMENTVRMKVRECLTETMLKLNLDKEMKEQDCGDQR